jgi:hypothetical protein
MIEDARPYDVIVSFWEWYRQREARYNPLVSYALDKCEETFGKCEWESFAYWHKVYVRERRRPQTSSERAIRLSVFRREAQS